MEALVEARHAGSGYAAPADVEVLIVEDDEDDVVLMKRCLRDCELNVGIQTAANGRDALSLLRNETPFDNARRPNIVLLDLNMPVMNGPQFLKELRSDPTLCSIPVVVITTSDEVEVVGEAYDCGANSVVTKANSMAGMSELMRLVMQYWFRTSHIYYVD